MKAQINLLYERDVCCGDHVELADNIKDGWESIIDDFAKQLHGGGGTDQVNLDLYFKTANHLAEAITSQLGNGFDYDAPENLLTAQFKANLYQFSGAKSLTESLLFADLMTDENGDLKPFNKFRDDIQKIHQQYNIRHLNTEYKNATATAQMALKWKNYEGLGVEWLEYRTVGDKRVRPEHFKLDGLVLRFDSAVWDRIYPPNDHGCRCTTVPADKPDKPTDEREAGLLGKEVVTNPVFENNPGKTGLVYKDSHPYFKAVSGKLKELDAVSNYGMQPVDKILLKTNLPAGIHLDTEADYLSWWTDMVKSHGVDDSNFALQDKLGIKVLFDASPNGKNKASYFRDHILQKKAEKRYEYAANLKDIIETADEIWFFNYLGKTPTYSYLKYYDGKAICITTNIDGNKVVAKTMFELDNNKSKKEVRRGVLMYKK